MKILILIYSLKAGGAEKQAILDANSLSALGHDVTLAWAEEGELADLLQPTVRRWRLRRKNSFLCSLELLFHLHSRRYDVIHAHMFWAAKAAAPPARITRHPLLLNEHGLGLWRRPHHRWIFRQITRTAAAVIASSNACLEVRRQRDKIPAGKLLRIPNAYFPRGNDKNRTEENSSEGDTGVFTVGFVGRIHPVKRLEILFELAQRLQDQIPGLKFMVIGDGSERGKLMNKSKEMGLDRNFQFPGLVLHPENYYPQFQVFVLPSLRESLPVCLLEAGAAGIPVIAFAVGGNPDVIRHGETGYLVPDGDIEKMAYWLRHLWENPESRRLMGEKAKQWIRENFSQSHRIQLLMPLYERKK